MTEVLPEQKKRELLTLAYAAEAYSDHPIAQSIREAYLEEKKDVTPERSVMQKKSQDAGSVPFTGGKSFLPETGS